MTLLPGLSPDNPKRGNVGVVFGAFAGVTLADLFCARRAEDQQS